MRSRDRIEMGDPAPFFDTAELRWIMTVHSATFDKLVAMRASKEGFGDFFADIASTYGRVAADLRRVDLPS